MLPVLAFVATATAAPVEVTVWHAYREQERAAFEAALAAWDAATPEAVVVPLAVPYDGFAAKLEAAIPRDNGPDLFVAAHERVGDWAGRGLIAPLPVPEGLHPATTAAFRYDGQSWGVPLAWKCLALYWNRALLDAPPETTDALRALAPALREKGAVPLAYPATEPYFHAPLLHAFGGAVLVDGAVRLDAPGNAASIAFARGLLESGVIPDETTSALVSRLFNDGKAATAISGPWFRGELAPGLDWAVAPLPVVSETGRRAAPFLTVEGVLLNARARNPGPAAALAAWLASPEGARGRAVDGGQSVATLATYDLPEVAQDPVQQAFRAQLDSTVPMPNTPAMATTWEPLARGLRKAMRGATTPEMALAGAMTEWRALNRPAPAPANPLPWAVGAGLLGLAGVGALGVQLARHRKAVVAHGFAYAAVAPAALSMAVLVVLPFLVGAAVSLFETDGHAFTFVGLAHFADILFSRDWPLGSPLNFWTTLLVTVGWTAANVVLHTGLGLGLALLLREPWVRLRGVFRVLLILPWAVPNYITALIWKGMFHRQFGAVNALLGLVGVEPVSWFSSFSTAFAANLATNTWLGFPFMMVVTLGALQSIPRDLEQAAEVDGASGWQRFLHITLPLLKPALLPAIVLGSVWTFNMFNVIYLVSAGEPDGATDILISQAYRWAFTRGHRTGYAAAYAVIIFGVLLVGSRVGNRLAGRRVL